MSFWKQCLLWPFFLVCGLQAGIIFPSVPSFLLWGCAGVGGALSFGSYWKGWSVFLWVLGIGLMVGSLGFLRAQWIVDQKGNSFLGPLFSHGLEGDILSVKYRFPKVFVVLENLKGSTSSEEKDLRRSRLQGVEISIPCDSFIPSLFPGNRIRISFLKIVERKNYDLFEEKGIGWGEQEVPLSQLSIKEGGFGSFWGKQRQRLMFFLWDCFPLAVRGLALALITGEKSVLGASVKEDFSRAGLSHLLAISGLHLSLMAGIFFVWGRRILSFSSFLVVYTPLKKIVAGGAILLSFIYLKLAGSYPPAQRAFLMVSLGFLGILCQRKVSSFYTLSLAGFWMLLWDPQNLNRSDFQLSFLAVLGILRGVASRVSLPKEGASLWKRGFYRVQESFRPFLWVTGTTLPLTLLFFGSFPIYGFISNCVAVPFLGMLLMPSFVLMILGWPLWSILHLEGVWQEWVSGLLALLITWAHKVASWPGSTLYIPSFSPEVGWIGSWGIVGLCVGNLIGVPVLKKRFSPFIWGGLLSVVFVLCMGGLLWQEKMRRSRVWIEKNPTTGKVLRAYVREDGVLMVPDFSSKQIVRTLMQKTGTQKACLF